ncbi:hypothetical protein DSO57_1006020 [Entomophthora muscae]|uniref:Uncharacterized protein n=1 Tax=Entomophthora muscae TaxID=34485 RepID=A0ACC2T7Z2_9FUNG|nr:hypothetical protein DSO57_1006020 [Entomophthora muscae]
MSLRVLVFGSVLLNAIIAEGVSEKVSRCKQSCLGELVCSKTCDFLDELNGSLGNKIEACLKPCTTSSCTNECVFKHVGLGATETKAYVALENALSPCYKMANTAALDCANRQSCMQTDMACIQKCSDQLENPQYISCVSEATNTTAKDIESSNACRQSCLSKANNLKASYSCGVTCGSAFFKGLGMNLSDLNLTESSSATNETFKRNATAFSFNSTSPMTISVSSSSTIPPLLMVPLIASILASNYLY